MYQYAFLSIERLNKYPSTIRQHVFMEHCWFLFRPMSEKKKDYCYILCSMKSIEILYLKVIAPTPNYNQTSNG